MADRDRLLQDTVTVPVDSREAPVRSGNGEPPWMAELRLRARERFSRLEWPTPQEEEWRRTDITGIDFGRYQAAGGALEASGPAGEDGRGKQGDSGEGSAEEAHTPDGEGFAGSALFVGPGCAGRTVKQEWREKGVVLAPLASAFHQHGERLKGLLQEGVESLDNRFLAWHFSYLSHGVYLYVPPNLEIREPFLLDFRIRGQESLSCPHVVVVLDRGARAVVVQRLAGGEGELLVNGGLDIRVGEAAGLEYFQVQDLGPGALFFSHGSARLARDGHLQHFEALFGGRLLKSRFDCSLEGRGSESFLNGVYFARGSQHMDIRSVQRHLAPQGTSRAFYKGAVKDGSRSVYQGLIEVSPGAAKTDAFLTNKNLILNDGARSDSIPSLKIGNNDVKCSHGSTTGRINEEELFYLMSRGLSREEARQMLIVGYFDELLDRAPNFLRDELRGLIERRL